MNDNTDDNSNNLLAETAFNLWKHAKRLEEILWQSFHDEFDELFAKETLERDLETDSF